MTATGAHAQGRGDVRVVKTVVNGGGNVIVGTAQTVRHPVDITVKDNSGVKGLTHGCVPWAVAQAHGTRRAARTSSPVIPTGRR
ncbi:hypothetical protein [Streptomyces sp. NPDC001100]